MLTLGYGTTPVLLLLPTSWQENPHALGCFSVTYLAKCVKGRGVVSVVVSVLLIEHIIRAVGTGRCIPCFHFLT